MELEGLGESGGGMRSKEKPMRSRQQLGAAIVIGVFVPQTLVEVFVVLGLRVDRGTASSAVGVVGVNVFAIATLLAGRHGQGRR